MTTTDKSVVATADVTLAARHAEALLPTGALQRAIFNSANFSGIVTDAHGVIQIFNVGAERMLGYAAADVVNTTRRLTSPTRRKSSHALTPSAWNSAR